MAISPVKLQQNHTQEVKQDTDKKKLEREQGWINPMTHSYAWKSRQLAKCDELSRVLISGSKVRLNDRREVADSLVLLNLLNGLFVT